MAIPKSMRVPKMRYRKKISKDRQQDRKIRKLARLVKPEIKWTQDGQVYNSAPGIAGTIYNVARTSAGDLNTQRVGLKVRARYLQVRMYLQNLTSGQSRFRVILFKWTDDTLPVVGNVLSTNLANANNQALAPQNPLYRPKCKILYDKMVFCGRDFTAGANYAPTVAVGGATPGSNGTYTTTSSGVANAAKLLIIRKKFNFDQTYLDDNLTGGEKNRLFFCIIGENANNTVSMEPLFSYNDA